MSQQKLPPGWDQERVQKVLGHYEEQTEEEAIAEDEAAFEDWEQTFMGPKRPRTPDPVTHR